MERNTDASQAQELAGDLRHAIESGELSAYFQPVYDLATRRIVAVEALCRWIHPQRGVLLPDRFIQVAEQHGMIADLGRVMLEEAGRRVSDWHRRGMHVGLSVNVSPSELRPAFASAVLERVAAFGLPPRTLTMEITESPAMTSSPEERATLKALIEGGVGVAVDDFGAGYTSLAGLPDLPFTEIKLDKALMHDDSADVETLVSECVSIAREREALVVAEGVETAEQLARAAAWGCDRVQGFYFAPALPADELERLLVTAEQGCRV